MTGPLAHAGTEPSLGRTSVDVAVSASSVSKTFRLPHEKYTTTKHRVLHPLAHRSYESLEALRDVSFDVLKGESFGIVGRNGSGKSTLLKCLSRIYRIDDGEIAVRGRLAPFIELGVGFNPELTARDNVLANAVLLGLTRAQARARFDEIIAFAELEPFVDLKLKNFSSGMTVRLGFAVTTQVDADVLLFDEVLKVGDESFEAKCLQYLDHLADAGRTVLVVTHHMKEVERYCDRAMLLDRGRVAEIGGPTEIARAYHAENARAKGAVPVHDRGARRRHAHPRRAGWHRPSPRSFRSELHRLGNVTWTLATADFKLKYFDAVLSYLWVLVKPLAFFGILYFVFTGIGKFDQGIPHYPLYLLSSLVLWLYFAEATSRAVYSLVAHEPLLRRLPLPHIAVPLSVVITAFFDLCTSALAVLVFMLASGVTPRLSWLELFPIVMLFSLLIVGMAMLVSALYVRFRDVDHIWGLSRQLLFYASPIFYVATIYPANVKPILMASPLAATFTAVRHAVIDPTAPSVVAVSGGVAEAFVPVALVFGVFLLGLWVFHRESPTVAENL